MDDKYLNRSHTAGNEELTPNYGGSNSGEETPSDDSSDNAVL